MTKQRQRRDSGGTPRQPVAQAAGGGSARRAPRSRSRGRRNDSWMLWVGGALLLVLAVVLLATQNRSPAGTGQEVPTSQVPRIALAEANTQQQAGEAIFVDVRSQTEYEAAHITDALHIPLDEIESGSQELPRDAALITYCT